MTEQVQKEALAQPKQGHLEAFSAFLLRNKFLIPLALFVVFLAVSLPGISWGAPDVWHPDEVVVRSIKALYGEWKFSEINFDYPDLPQYTMFVLGKITLALGYGDKEILIASRVLSAVLAGLSVVLAYMITNKVTNNIYVAGLSGLLLVSASEMTHNARFAHNDSYITFFATLTLFFLINYNLFNRRTWLYASFLTVGMAASSKYNGISLLLAPVIIFLVSQRNVLFKRTLRVFETLFIGGALTILGYAIGTPKALFWMTYYFKRMIPALIHTGNYARQPDSVRGIIGQYASLADGIGFPLFILFSAAFLWACYRIMQTYRSSGEFDTRVSLIAVVTLVVIALDIPIALSYNFPTRFFLSMLPALAILGAIFVQDIHQWIRKWERPQIQTIFLITLSLLVIYSFARNISVMFLFFNDPRIAASQFIKTLPKGTSLEHTYYPPSIPENHFKRETNYPIYFKKDPNEVITDTDEWNLGEDALYDRGVDYFVVDSFTVDKFKSDYTCSSMKVECDFFKRLSTGQSNHYKQIAEFSYTLPVYLPQIDVMFVNPTIRIYERIQ